MSSERITGRGVKLPFCAPESSADSIQSRIQAEEDTAYITEDLRGLPPFRVADESEKDDLERVVRLMANVEHMRQDNIERYSSVPLADPEKLEVGDRVLFNNDNRWTCSRRIECTCECGRPHSGWIMRHQYETQLWWDTDTLWESTVLLEDWPRKKVIMDTWRENMFVSPECSECGARYYPYAKGDGWVQTCYCVEESDKHAPWPPVAVCRMCGKPFVMQAGHPWLAHKNCKCKSEDL